MDIDTDRIALAQNARMKREADRDACLLEYVADCLATRHPNFAAGLDESTLALYDPVTDRANYLLLQENLCDLTLPARRATGRSLAEVCTEVTNATDAAPMAYKAVCTDVKPDFLYVLVSARGLQRNVLADTIQQLLFGDLAFYEKTEGMVIADWAGDSFVVRYAKPSKDEIAEQKWEGIGAALYGKLRTFAEPMTLFP